LKTVSLFQTVSPTPLSNPQTSEQGENQNRAVRAAQINRGCDFRQPSPVAPACYNRSDNSHSRKNTQFESISKGFQFETGGNRGYAVDR